MADIHLYHVVATLFQMDYFDPKLKEQSMQRTDITSLRSSLDPNWILLLNSIYEPRNSKEVLQVKQLFEEHITERLKPNMT
jgi:hypothetical protein